MNTSETKPKVFDSTSTKELENGKFTRRQFFRSIGVATLVAVALKFLPNSLWSSTVRAEYTGCDSCYPSPNCGCECWFIDYDECGFDFLNCETCAGGHWDRLLIVEYWVNEPINACCVSLCIPPFFWPICSDPTCPSC